MPKLMTIRHQVKLLSKWLDVKAFTALVDDEDLNHLVNPNSIKSSLTIQEECKTDGYEITHLILENNRSRKVFSFREKASL